MKALVGTDRECLVGGHLTIGRLLDKLLLRGEGKLDKLSQALKRQRNVSQFLGIELILRQDRSELFVQKRQPVRIEFGGRRRFELPSCGAGGIGHASYDTPPHVRMPIAQSADSAPIDLVLDRRSM